MAARSPPCRTTRATCAGELRQADAILGFYDASDAVRLALHPHQSRARMLAQLSPREGQGIDRYGIVSGLEQRAGRPLANCAELAGHGVVGALRVFVHQ